MSPEQVGLFFAGVGFYVILFRLSAAIHRGAKARRERGC